MAISITTKNGFDFPGLAQGYGGSFRRAAADIEYGGSADRVGYYVTGNAFYERGWRENTSTHIWQGFGKLSSGSGHQPGFQLHRREQHVERGAGDPDLLPFSSGPAELHVSGHLQERAHRVHADGSTPCPSEACCRARCTRPPQQELQHERERRFRSHATHRAWQHRRGECGDRREHEGLRGSVQLPRQPRALPNQLTIGASLDAGRTDFTQSDQEANFASDRSSIPVGGFVMETQARTTNQYWGVYFTDTLSPAAWVDVTLAGRYNWAQEKSRISRDQSGARRHPQIQPVQPGRSA